MNSEVSSAENSQPEIQSILKGHYEHLKAAESARRALLARRRISLRVQIFVSFFLIFLFTAGVAILLMSTSHQVEEKLRMLEVVNDYVAEIQQARRFEKNYFLYGTNLSDALENIYRAKDIFDRNEPELRKVLGKNDPGFLVPNFKLYEELLKRLVDLHHSEKGDQVSPGTKNNIELELRKQGQQMISFAQDLMSREKTAVSEALRRSRNIHIYSLIFLLFFIALNAYLLGSRILGTIDRFAAYSRRIASGDFTPITPARSYRDEFTDLAICINDMIQELENREAILIQSHKMRAVGTLTAGVAHELNNPLNNITLTAHMLLEDYEKLADEERKEMVEDVISEAKRSKDIISNLLDFARESSSQVEPLDLKQVLKDTIDLASNQLKLANIRVSFQAMENLPRVHGDSQQLRQVFLNLILNAIDASPKGAKIEILVLAADDPSYLAVKVIDFGTGIPEHILGSIFDPFFTTKGKGKGTGLGLSVSQGIIAKHGGQIRVTSREGKGSTFTVTLPVTTIPAEISPPKQPQGG